MKQQKGYPIPWIYFGTMLLLLAHVTAVLSLLLFGSRAGDYPIHPIGLGVYLTAAVLAVIGLAIGLARFPAPTRLTTKLLLFSLPVFVSLTFRAALWMTPWLGGAPYAPWDTGDGDILFFFNLFFAGLWSVVAVLYGSYAYLFTAAGGWVLAITMAGFPDNGMVLGWTATAASPPRQVPEQAWGWARSAAHYLGILAVTAVPLAAFVQWVRNRSREQAA